MIFKYLQIKRFELESFNEIQQDFRVRSEVHGQISYQAPFKF